MRCHFWVQFLIYIMPQYPQCCVEYGVTTDSAIYGTARLCSWNYSHWRTFSFNWDRCFILVFSWRQMIWNPYLYLNCLCLWCRFWFRRQPHSMWPSIALNGPSVRMCSFCSFVFLFYFRILFTIYMVFFAETGPSQWVFVQDCRYRWPYDFAPGHQGPVSR